MGWYLCSKQGFDEVDRAQAEAATEGFTKSSLGGMVRLGAHLVGPSAGELIQRNHWQCPINSKFLLLVAFTFTPLWQKSTVKRHLNWLSRTTKKTINPKLVKSCLTSYECWLSWKRAFWGVKSVCIRYCLGRWEKLTVAIADLQDLARHNTGAAFRFSLRWLATVGTDVSTSDRC